MAVVSRLGHPRMTRCHAYVRVKAARTSGLNCWCESLGVEKDDVVPSAALRADLGAESIDFLDIVFRLEREFKIKIGRNELFPDLISPDDSRSSLRTAD